MDDAKAKASAEMKVYKSRLRTEKEAAGERALDELGVSAKAIENAKPKPRGKTSEGS